MSDQKESTMQAETWQKREIKHLKYDYPRYFLEITGKYPQLDESMGPLQLHMPEWVIDTIIAEHNAAEKLRQAEAWQNAVVKAQREQYGVGGSESPIPAPKEQAYEFRPGGGYTRSPEWSEVVVLYGTPPGIGGSSAFEVPTWLEKAIVEQAEKLRQATAALEQVRDESVDDGPHNIAVAALAALAPTQAGEDR